MQYQPSGSHGAQMECRGRDWTNVKANRCVLNWYTNSLLKIAIECFYNNDGIWYYAGSYKSCLIDVISTQEWEQLSSEVNAIPMNSKNVF